MATSNYWDLIDWDLPLGDIAKPMEQLWPQKSESKSELDLNFES